MIGESAQKTVTVNNKILSGAKMWRNKDKIKWLTRHPVYQFSKNLRELLLVVLFWLTVAKSPFGKPTIELCYRLDRLYPPVATESRIKKTTGKTGEENPLSPLINSRDLLRIRIWNNSSEAIRNVDLQIEAFSIADIAVSSNSSHIMSDRIKLATFEISENFVARFPNFTSIPPRAEIEMLIWGDICTLIWGKPVQIFSSAKTVNVVEEGMVSGIRLFVARNISVLTIFLAIALLLLGLKRYRRTQTE